MPIDAAHQARDQWAQYTQGKGTVRAYIDRFHYTLLHVQDAAPAEVLDHFIRGLAPLVRAQVLVQDPVDFYRAAIVAERVAGAHGKPAHHRDPPGSIPMDIRAMKGPSFHPSAHPRSGGNGGCSNDKRTYHYCKQPGHFILSCLKLKQDIEIKATGQFPTH